MEITEDKNIYCNEESLNPIDEYLSMDKIQNDCNNNFLSTNKVQNDCIIYATIEQENAEIVNNPIYRIYSNKNIPYALQRQSEQMETFVDNFIKPEIKDQKKTIPNVMLTKELMKRVSRKQTNFNLIIIGEQGIGKSTFIEAFVKNNSTSDVKETDESDKIITGNIVETPYVLMNEEQKIYFNIIEVLKFGNEMNNENLLFDILGYVNQKFKESFKLECSLDRSSAEDKKIHCCLYFISPFGHSLKPLDIAFFKLFQSKFNIIPIIGRCDIFTNIELKKFKDNIFKDFEKYGINLFEYLENSVQMEDDVDDIKEICEEIKNNIPFAISCSINMVMDVDNNVECGREYPWGILKTNNPTINDFSRLETILTKSHINFFKKLTKTVYYENFRMKYILDRV